MFNLEAAYREEVGRSDSYFSTRAMANGVEPVMGNAPAARVDDLTA